jgi:branched-chain amino acid transport system substrate-binding protein
VASRTAGESDEAEDEYRYCLISVVGKHLTPPSGLAAAAVACLLGACSVPGVGGAPAPLFKIGVDLPLSGAEGRVATPALNGVQYYVQQHPTLDGFSVQLSVKDDSLNGQPEPPLGASNVAGFVADPQVMAVIGPFDSSVARAEIPVANQSSLAKVSPATSSPCLTRSDYLPAALQPAHVAVSCKQAGLPSAADLRPSGFNNYFRLAATDDLQGPAAADYAYKTLHVLRVAVVSDHEAYGQALADGFETHFRSLGGSIVGTLDYDPSLAVDATGFLKRVKADGVQAVYFGGLAANKGCVVRSQMTGIFDPAAPFLGGDGIAEDPACIRDAGGNSSGIYATVPIVNAATIGTAEPVITGFHAIFPLARDFGAYTVIAYDATALVYDAIDRAIRATGGLRPARGNVLSQLSVTSGFAGATGVIGFDQNGDSTHRVISVVEADGGGGNDPWRFAGSVDYTAALPY